MKDEADHNEMKIRFSWMVFEIDLLYKEQLILKFIHVNLSLFTS